MKSDLKKIRREYGLFKLSYHDLLKNPIDQFSIWLEHAIQSNIKDPNAMVLSTYDNKNGVSSRVVLLKNIIDQKTIPTIETLS